MKRKDEKHCKISCESLCCVKPCGQIKDNKLLIWEENDDGQKTLVSVSTHQNRAANGWFQNFPSMELTFLLLTNTASRPCLSTFPD